MSETPLTIRSRPLLIAALIVGSLAIDYFLPVVFFAGGGRWFEVLGLGLYMGQLDLLAIFLALSPGPLVIRLPSSLLVGVVITAAICLGSATVGAAARPILPFILFLITGLVVMPLPMWICARALNWRLYSWHAPPGADSQPAQFQLKHLMCAVFLCAVALAIGRTLRTENTVGTMSAGGMTRTARGILAMVLCNLLIALPTMRVAFARAEWLAVWCLCCGWLFCAVVTAGEMVALGATLGFHIEGRYGLYYAANLLQAFVVTATLVALRAAGCTLRIRAPRQVASAAGG